MEAYALAVYQDFCRDAGLPDEIRLHPDSGAEFWVQVRGAGGEEPDEQEISWHCDKDEERWDQEQICVAPALATVTYLTDGGTPTVVVDSPCRDDASLAPGRHQAVVCQPKTGRHLRFQGNLLHAVPSELAEPGYSEMRVTVLVNVWLGHKPSELKRFEARGEEGEEAPLTLPQLQTSLPMKLEPPNLSEEKETKKCKPFSFGGQGYRLQVPLSHMQAGLMKDWVGGVGQCTTNLKPLDLGDINYTK